MSVAVTIDQETLEALVEHFERATESLRPRRLGSTKKVVMAWREDVARKARIALAMADDIPAHKIEGTQAEFDRFIAGDR